MSMKFLFCRVPWMEEYDGTESDCPEAETFLPVEITGEDGSLHSLLLGTVSGKTALDISGLCEHPADGFASGVTVVFCAETPNGILAAVGWYQNANVSARKEAMEFSDENGGSAVREFFFCGRTEDAVLLPLEDRFSFLPVPRNKSKTPGKYGFSADAVWYARESAAKSWLASVEEKILSYDGENWLEDADEEDVSGTEDTSGTENISVMK